MLTLPFRFPLGYRPHPTTVRPPLQGRGRARREQAEEDILQLLDSCTLQQLQILQDVLRSVKESLDLRLR